MDEFVKTIKTQDAKYRKEETISGDTRINLSEDLFSFLNGKINQKIQFVIYKEDFIKALCFMTTIMPLHYSPNSHTLETEEFSTSHYLDRLKVINDFFGDNKTSLYEAKFTTATNGNRYWLCGLKNEDFNLREFLVSEKCDLKFIKNDDDTFDLRIIYLDNNIVPLDNVQTGEISSSNVNRIQLPAEIKHCARRIINYMYAADEFHSIQKFFSLGKTGTTITIDDGNDIKMNGVFFTETAPNFDYSGEGKKRAFYNTEYDIILDNLHYTCHLIVDWYEDVEDNSNKENAAQLITLIALVNKYYCSFFHIIKEKETYILLNKKNIHVIDDNFEYSVEKLINDFNKQFADDSFAYRYFVALLAKRFVILSGNSGTGKTKISKDIADWLGKVFVGCSDVCNKLIVPIGADWTDNTKLLGFYNPITHLYQPTEILRFVIAAKANPAIPFFLVLDEMNLSHVERYFADFLSAMESNEPILLYKRDKECKEEIIPEFIKIPNNLYVTGTVNIDETTYMFSPKVLDRANVIEFKPTKESVLSLLDNNNKTLNINPINNGDAEAFQVLSNSIKNSEINAYNEIPFSSLKDVLDKFYCELEKSGFEFAYRTVKEIIHYVIASFKMKGAKNYKIEKSIDEQIVQKVLPKIHGNKKQIGALLTELEKLCVENGDKKLRKNTEIEIEGKGVYYLELSFEKIGEMQTKLNTTQYASFI